MFIAGLIFLLSYLAVVSQFVETPLEPIVRHIPAMMTVLVARSQRPISALGWAFLLGLAVDAIGSGPLGVHAATLTTVSSLCVRQEVAGDRLSPWRWMGMMMSACFFAGLAPVLGTCWKTNQWAALPDVALSFLATSVIVSLFVGLMVCVWYQLGPQPRWSER